MTLRSRDLFQIPDDTKTIGQKLLPEDNLYRIIGEHLGDILQDQQFASMYKTTGRDAIWPSLLGMVTIFQFQESVPDRDAAEAVVLRIDWKYALHLPLDYAGFHYSDLCDFRKRVTEHGQESLIFDAILKKVQALGFIKKRGKQRTDSLAVVGAVRQLSVLETVTETLRVTLRAMMKADPAWVEKAVPAAFQERYVQTRPDYKMKPEEREAELLKAGQDGYWLLAQVAASAPEEIKTLEEVRTMQTVWEQRYHRVEGTAVVREKGVKATERIVTPHDPGVRAGEKRGKQWDGDKVHVTETAEAGADNFITDVTTGNASGGDAEALPEVREHLAEQEALPGEQYVDAAYVSGQQMAQSEAAGIQLMGPALPDTSPNEYKIRDFQIDHEAREATCPQGHKSVKWTGRVDRDGSAAVNIAFDAATCAECPARARCTSSKSGRSLHINEHYERVEARREEAKTEEFREKMRARPAIEATLSELVRRHGMRRHRYRGDIKRHFENLLKGAACNLKRLARALWKRWEQAKRAGAGEPALMAAASS